MARITRLRVRIGLLPRVWTAGNYARRWPSVSCGAGTLPAALTQLAAQASCARQSRLKAGCGQNCPPHEGASRCCTSFSYPVMASSHGPLLQGTFLGGALGAGVECVV